MDSGQWTHIYISSRVTLGELIITNIPKYSRFDGIPNCIAERTLNDKRETHLCT